MLSFGGVNENKRVCMWIDEAPFKHVSNNVLHMRTESGDINWHIGTICLEVKLSPLCVSNYAMVCMKYTNNKKNEADIIINFGREDFFFESQVLPFSKEVVVGLDKEFADAINDFFKEYPSGKLPSGTIEIFSGAFDEVGSSNIAFKKTMNLLIFVFQHIDEFKDDELRCELLKLM